MNKFLQRFKKQNPNTEIDESLYRMIPGSVKYMFVEKKIDDEHFRQGVKILDGKYKNLIFTTSPKVGIEHQEDGTVKLSYSYDIERLPEGMTPETVEYDLIEQIVGDVIMDIINTEYAEKE